MPSRNDTGRYEGLRPLNAVLTARSCSLSGTNDCGITSREIASGVCGRCKAGRSLGLTCQKTRSQTEKGVQLGSPTPHKKLTLRFQGDVLLPCGSITSFVETLRYTLEGLNRRQVDEQRRPRVDHLSKSFNLTTSSDTVPGSLQSAFENHQDIAVENGPFQVP